MNFLKELGQVVLKKNDNHPTSVKTANIASCLLQTRIMKFNISSHKPVRPATVSPMSGAAGSVGMVL